MSTRPTRVPVIQFGGIYERDIDLLLVVELAATPLLCDWLVSRALGRDVSGVALKRVARGVPSSNGESDLRIEVDLGQAETACLLVENKIAASFQPNQAARYAERARQERATRAWSVVVTVLLASRAYLGDGSHGFDCTIAYEDLLDALKEALPSGARSQVVTGLVVSAIRKAREGYDRVVDGPVTSFWASYWDACCREFPDLRMPTPGGRPSKSSFVRFSLPPLPIEAQLIHKLTQGAVDLQFSGCHAAVLQRHVGAALGDGMRVLGRGKSAAVRLDVPMCNAGRPFAEQVEAVRAGLTAAQQLAAWSTTHERVLLELAAALRAANRPT